MSTEYIYDSYVAYCLRVGVVPASCEVWRSLTK